MASRSFSFARALLVLTLTASCTESDPGDSSNDSGPLAPPSGGTDAATHSPSSDDDMTVTDGASSNLDAAAQGTTTPSTTTDAAAQTGTTPSTDAAAAPTSSDTTEPTPNGTDAAASPSLVDLGLAGNFVILAKSGISTVPPSALVGDLGLSPAAATFITGFSLTEDALGVFATAPQVTGKVYAANYADETAAMLTDAVGDMQLAYTDAAGRAADFSELGAGDLSSMTLTPGVYKWGTGVTIPSDLTLAGDESDVWIFQIAQDLILSSGTNVVLSGGALPEHVFWQVAGLVELGTTAHAAGIVLAQTSVALQTGASLDGRLLAQTAVTLDSSTVVEPAH